MSLDSTPSEKIKSFLIATLIYGVLLLILFFIRFWPPSDAELAALAGGGGGEETADQLRLPMTGS